MTTVPDPLPTASEPFIHPALFYRGLEDYLTGVGGFVEAALAAGEPVLVAVPGPRLAALRDRLGPARDGLALVDMTELGRNPGRILAALRDFADRHPGRAARIVGEPIWPGRSRAETTEATRHEALINLAFAGRTATVLCPYDANGLPARVLADARRTHPVVVEDGRERPSPHYADPADVGAGCDTPLPDPPGDGTVAVDFSAGLLSAARHRADVWAAEAGLDARRRTDFVLAVGEATTNSVAHGGGYGTLRLWTDRGVHTAEVRDRGRLADPLAGRRRPSPESADGGRGLWMIHQLCDLVETRAGSGGLVLRMHMAAGGS